MIVWYCDICGNRIADDTVYSYSNMPVWEVNGYITPIANIKKDVKSRLYLKIIVCEDCKDFYLESLYKLEQQTIKDKRGKKEQGKK